MIQKYPNKEKASRALWSDLQRLIIELLEKKPRISIVLSGGRTPDRLFELMDDSENINWSAIDIFWVDERMVPRDSPENNANNAMAKFQNQNPNFYPIDTSVSADHSALLYQNEIEKYLKSTENECLDILLLGMGQDGHYASLFPDSTALDENNKSVTSNYVEKLQAERITMTIPLIDSIKYRFILAGGSEKVALINILIENPDNTYPISRLLENYNSENLYLYE